MSVKILMAVAAGGAFGAVGRYCVTVGAAYWIGVGFPIGTVIANLLGSFILGIIYEASLLAWSPTAELRSFLIVGVLGGFTTFSGFSLDAFNLWERGDVWLAVVYVSASVVLGVLCFFFGLTLMRALLA